MPILHYENVNVGDEITALVKHPTTEQLVRWAGASGDYVPIHYDKDIAQSVGLSGVIVHGILKLQFLTQMVTDWMGPEGTLKKISCRYKGMDYPGDTLTCKGKVTNKFIDGDEYCLECELSCENQRGENTTPGSAIIVLPVQGRQNCDDHA